MQKIDFRSWCLGIFNGVLIKVLASIILVYWPAPEAPVNPPCTASALIEVATQRVCI
ncbi:TPA: hypothetical protein SAN82_005636 [Pseudomonas putida]|nr:hypothetical protein [Pseudomonas putida]